jgi:glycosyltransferase involved in cell wall biosynthesis
MRVISRMNLGGPAIQISGLMRGIDKERFEQRLYTGLCSSDELDYLDHDAKDINATRITGLGKKIHLTGDIRALFNLIKEIRLFKPHIIHTHTAKAGFLGRLASLMSLHPTIRIHTFHGHLLNGYFGKIGRFAVIVIEKFLSYSTDYLLAVGSKVREDLLAVGIGNSERFGLMPPGLGIGHLPDRQHSRQEFNLPMNSLQCAMIGRVTKIKRPDRFLDLVNEMLKRKSNIEFLLVGDGDLLEECKERILYENLPVRVLGWQSKIEKVLAVTDIVVLTSDNEGMPLSLIQAGMAGIPVVATNVGSVSEVVINGKSGITTDLEIRSMADGLEFFEKNQVSRTKFGEIAQEFTLKKFGTNRLVLDHEKLYLGLLNKN